jgi:hypothetical protein
MPVVAASFSVKFCQLALLVGVKQHLIFNRLWGGLPIYNVLPGRVALPKAEEGGKGAGFWLAVEDSAKPRRFCQAKVERDLI